MKKKLFAAAISLAIATIMLTSASFAWFTVSQTALVDDIEVKMEATKNLEIARAKNTTAPDEVTVNDEAGTDFTWGSTVTGFKTGATTQTAIVRPATMKESKLQTVKYATDGRTDGLIAATMGDMNQEGIIDFTQDGKVVGKLYAVWLRSNYLGDVTASISNATVGGGATDAQKTKIKDALTIKLATYSSGTWTLTDTTNVTLTPNVAKLVGVVVYFEGETANGGKGLVAADVSNGATITGLDIGFAAASN